MDAITPAKLGPHKYLRTLQDSFGFSNFRKMQWNVINSMLASGRDHCLYAGSASGKSLCYQFPSVHLNTITLVVSPFISLMEDQVQQLNAKQIRACFLGSANPDKDTIEDLIAHEYNIVYVTPEYITCDRGEYLLNEIGDFLTMIAIDEAHLVCEWADKDGFRPAFGLLRKMRMQCPEVPVLALTSVSTERTRDEIIDLLGLKNPIIYSYSTDRANIFYNVASIQKAPCFWERCEMPMIVFCRTANVADSLAAEIQAHGFECRAYHSYLPMEYRKNIQTDFQNNFIDILVTTISGLGFTKPDVRTVVHYDSVTDLERYYREVGVAGRDGLPASSILFYSSLPYNLLKYALTKSCRRQFLRSYFDENYKQSSWPRDCCDNC